MELNHIDLNLWSKRSHLCGQYHTKTITVWWCIKVTKIFLQKILNAVLMQFCPLQDELLRLNFCVPPQNCLSSCNFDIQSAQVRKYSKYPTTTTTMKSQVIHYINFQVRTQEKSGHIVLCFEQQKNLKDFNTSKASLNLFYYNEQ